MPRPYIEYTSIDLLEIVRESSDLDELETVLAELNCRTRLPARILRAFVEYRIRDLVVLQGDSEFDTNQHDVNDLPTVVENAEEPDGTQYYIDEDIRDRVRARVVRMWGLTANLDYRSCRRAFLLDETLLVAGSFADDATVSSIQFVSRGVDLTVSSNPLDEHAAVDLVLYAVDRSDVDDDWGS